MISDAQIPCPLKCGKFQKSNKDLIIHLESNCQRRLVYCETFCLKDASQLIPTRNNHCEICSSPQAFNSIINNYNPYKAISIKETLQIQRSSEKKQNQYKKNGFYFNQASSTMDESMIQMNFNNNDNSFIDNKRYGSNLNDTMAESHQIRGNYQVYQSSYGDMSFMQSNIGEKYKNYGKRQLVNDTMIDYREIIKEEENSKEENSIKLDNLYDINNNDIYKSDLLEKGPFSNFQSFKVDNSSNKDEENIKDNKAETVHSKEVNLDDFKEYFIN
jgi:hypothetical protein